MKFGVVFPQSEIEPVPERVRAYAQGVERMGFRHLLAYDHVLGADPAVHQCWKGPYDVTTTFQEPLVLFGYLAAVCNLELVTGILILPQRQTALVAKQAAQVDILTEGRFRLGVGLGWNSVEYEALGKKFTDRGRRLEEQVELLRRLWTERSITHNGRFEVVTGAGLAPLPRQRPIPIWFGAQSDPALRRAGRLADGWFPQTGPGSDLERARSVVDEGAGDAGRDPSELGMEGRATVKSGQVGELVETVGRWQEAGATHVSINTMGSGLRTAEEHLGALAEVADALSLKPAAR